MPNKIQLKRTSVTGRTPNTTNSGNSSYIDAGELAINITDGKLFSSNGTNYIEVGANLNNLSVTGNVVLGDASSDSITINGTIQPGVVISGGLANTAALRITQTNTGTGSIALRVEDEANPDSSPFMIDSEGRVRIGTNIAYNEKLVIFSNTITSAEPSIILRNQYPNANAPVLNFDKERTAGDPLQINDNLGTINFRGINENALQTGAQIKAEGENGINGGAGYMPARMTFLTASTTADSDPIERLRIDSLGVITANADVIVRDTLTIANSSTNTFVVGSSAAWNFGTSLDNLIYITKTIDSTSGTNQIATQTKSANATVTVGRNHFGIRHWTMVEHEHKNSGGTFLGTSYWGLAANVYNGNSSIGGDSRVTSLIGVASDVANYANGSNSNTVGNGIGASFTYEVRGSGITTNAYGARGLIEVANSTVTGNITTAFGYDSRITSNTAMTIATGYLYYGAHSGTTTTNKYGLYLTNESNNYLSGSLVVGNTINVGTAFTVNSTSANSNVKLAPLAGIVANGSLGSAGQVLISNSTGIYWGAVTGTAANPGGADTQVQFNDGGSAFGATAGFTFNKTTNNVTIGNTVTVGTTTVINSTAISLGPFGTTNGTLVTPTTLDIGNTSGNAALKYNIIYVANSTGRANLTPTTLAIGLITVNSALANLQALHVVNQTNTGTLFVTTSANVGTAFTANSTLVNTIALNVVNQTNTATLYVTTSANVASAFLANSTGAYHTGTMNAASHTVGTTTVVNSTAIALGPFGTTNGVLITTTSLDIGNTTANAALDYNIIYVANSTGRANLTPTTLAIGSITVNSALANLQALNVVNQTNTGTLFVTTSANVASAFLANSTGAYHTGTINAASHTVGTNFTSNSSQMILNAPSYTVSFSNTNGVATNYITWSTSLQQAIPSTTTRSLGTKIIFYEGLSASTTDWAYGLSGAEMWASVGATTGTFRWYAVTTAFMTSNTTFFNHTNQLRVGGGVGTTSGVTIGNTSISVGTTSINTSANSTAILVNGTDLVATQKRSIAMSLVFGR